MKYLRKAIYPKRVRYYMCGEYGEKLQRPHYHYLLFGYDFREDRYEWKRHRGHQYYRSPELESVWKFGHSIIGNVTLETAAYTARYVMKKITGDRQYEHYVNEDGVMLEPEFCLMSNRPGIGAPWFKKFGVSDIYDSGDFVLINGKKFATPSYYDKLYDELDERELVPIKEARILKARARAARDEVVTGRTQDEQLRVKEECTQHALRKLKRGYEDES